MLSAIANSRIKWCCICLNLNQIAIKFKLCTFTFILHLIPFVMFNISVYFTSYLWVRSSKILMNGCAPIWTFPDAHYLVTFTLLHRSDSIIITHTIDIGKHGCNMIISFIFPYFKGTYWLILVAIFVHLVIANGVKSGRPCTPPLFWINTCQLVAFRSLFAAKFVAML